MIKRFDVMIAEEADDSAALSIQIGNVKPHRFKPIYSSPNATFVGLCGVGSMIDCPCGSMAK
jgi:hypothetical protein